MDPTILIIIATVLIFFAIIMFIAYSVSGNTPDPIEEARIKKEEARKIREEKYQLKMSLLKETYGDITADVALYNPIAEWDDIKTRLLVFEESQYVLLNEEPIKFSKIISCTLVDNQKTIATTVGEGNNKTSTTSMAGRALVGGVLLGGAGALAGAVTAKNTTSTSSTTNYSTNHSFKIFLGIDDLSNPQRILNLGSDEISANKISTIMSIIINRNNR